MPNQDASPRSPKQKKRAKRKEKDQPAQKEKTKSKKLSKVPLGIALMESFTAKNTKKDRLTVGITMSQEDLIFLTDFSHH